MKSAKFSGTTSFRPQSSLHTRGLNYIYDRILRSGQLPYHGQQEGKVGKASETSDGNFSNCSRYFRLKRFFLWSMHSEVQIYRWFITSKPFPLAKNMQRHLREYTQNVYDTLHLPLGTSWRTMWLWYYKLKIKTSWHPKMKPSMSKLSPDDLRKANVS